MASTTTADLHHFLGRYLWSYARMEKIRVLNICKSLSGGAGIAAKNIHSAILNHTEVESTLITQEGLRKSSKQFILRSKWSSDLFSIIHQKLSNLPLLFYSKKVSGRSFNLMPTCWHSMINRSQFDLVVVHWMGGGGMSIGDLSLIKKPVLWVLHDMWIFCGSKHVDDELGYLKGYSNQCWPVNFERWLWNKKNKALTHLGDNVSFVAPSEWMLRTARSSKMLEGFNIFRIPNPIDVSFWRELQRGPSDLLPNSADKINIVVGSTSRSALKGIRLFVEALKIIERESDLKSLRIIFFGKIDALQIQETPFDYINLGFIEDRKLVRDIYQSADLAVFPSFIESFGQMPAEALVAGTRVLVYGDSGSADFISESPNGFMFFPYDSSSLARAISKCLELAQRGSFDREAYGFPDYSMDASAVAYSYRERFIEVLRGRA